VVAIELLSAAQGLEYRELTPGKGVKAAYDFIRERVKSLDGDRELAGDIELIKGCVASGELVNFVEKRIGEIL